MLVYRISLEKWSNTLLASGRAARWNSNAVFILYAASTRALACLENLAHRTSLGSHNLFKTTVINISEDVKTEEVDKTTMPPDWTLYENFSQCQLIGDHWVARRSSAVLKVPSSIIQEEFNYLINPQHPDCSKIIIQKVEDFIFDPRLILRK